MKRNNERQKAMSIQQFIEVIKFLKQIGSVKELGLFYMGESALNKDLAAFCKLAKEEGFFTFLTTNGTVLRTVVEAIPYIDSLKVSWNYKSQEDFIKKTNASDKLYRTIKENIAVFKRECNKHKKKLTVSTVLDSPISEYTSELATLQKDDNYFLPLQSQCGLNAVGIDGVVGSTTKMRSSLPCWSLFKGVYVDSDLMLRTCCYGHNQDHVIGSIHDVDPRVIPGKVMQMRQLQLIGKIPDECKQCLRSLA